MDKINIVLDTNVLFAALNSNRGASFKLISEIPSELFELSVSVPLVVEYEDVLKRTNKLKYLTENDIDDFLNFIISVAKKQQIHYLWRPFLKDPADDMLVELAFAANANAIVTYNKKDFAGVEENFDIKVVDAKEILEIIGVLK